MAAILQPTSHRQAQPPRSSALQKPHFESEGLERYCPSRVSLPPPSVSSRSAVWLCWLLLLVAVILGSTQAEASFNRSLQKLAPIIPSPDQAQVIDVPPFTLELANGLICGNDPVNRHDPLGLSTLTFNLRGGGGLLDSGESWPEADLASFIAPISTAPRWMTSTSFLDDAYQSLLPSQLEMARKISLFGPSGMNPFDKRGISGAGRIANIKGSMTAAGINPASSEAMAFICALSPHFEKYDAYMGGIYAEQTRAANSAMNSQIFNLAIIQPLMFVLPELRVGRFLVLGADAGL